MSNESHEAAPHEHGKPESRDPCGSRDPGAQSTVTDPPGGSQLIPPPTDRDCDDHKRR
jgi:hypothetical protein